MAIEDRLKRLAAEHVDKSEQGHRSVIRRLEALELRVEAIVRRLDSVEVRLPRCAFPGCERVWKQGILEGPEGPPKFCDEHKEG